ALVDQRDRLGQGDCVLFDLARDRGVDAARGDVGAVTAALHGNGSERWMIADCLAGVSAEAAARALPGLLRNPRDRAIEADVEALVAGFKAGVGLLVLDERPEAAEACGDRLTGLGMLADLARQRQQFERELELDITGRGALRDAGAFRLLALRIVFLLAEL